MLKVKLMTYQDLPEEVREYQPNNGMTGKEHADYVVLIHNDKIIRVLSDAMEPEDASFRRDLKVVIKAIEEAYGLGLRDGLGG